MIASARVLLALIMLAALYMFTLTLVVLYLYLGGQVLTTGPSDNFPVNLFALVAGAPLLLAFVQGVMGRIAFGPRLDSVLVGPEQAPRLWNAVRELAEQVGTPAPTEIRLVADVNASVTEDVKLLGLLPGRKRMYIGAPLLVGMPAEELRAVLCHELGHYAHKHTRFAVPAYRGSAALAAALKNMAGKPLVSRTSVYGALVCFAVGGYAALYDRLTFAVRRRQELEADAEAAAITGRVVAAEALRSVHVLPAAWDLFIREYVEPTWNATGCVPRDLFRAFQVMLDDPGIRHMLIDMRRRPSERPRSPRDSHPNLATRLARLERCPVPERRSSSAIALLDAADPLFHDLCDIMPTCRAARNLPWTEWSCLLAECRATMSLEALCRAIDIVYDRRRDSSVNEVTLEEVLNLLEAGMSTELAAALRTSPPLAENTEQDLYGHLTDVISALIGHALVSAGAAQWLLCWTGPSQLLPQNTTQEKVNEWAATAVHYPARMSWLRMELAALGIDLTMPIPPAKSITNARSTATVDSDTSFTATGAGHQGTATDFQVIRTRAHELKMLNPHIRLRARAYSTFTDLERSIARNRRYLIYNIDCRRDRDFISSLVRNLVHDRILALVLDIILDVDRVRGLISDLPHDPTRRPLPSDLATDVIRGLSHARSLARSLLRDCTLARHRDLAIDLIRTLARAVNRYSNLAGEIDRARNLARNLARDRARGPARDRARDSNLYLIDAVVQVLSLVCIHLADMAITDLDDVLRDLDGVFSDLDDALNDFSTADLRSVDLHTVQIEGLRWSSATQWPAEKVARVMRDSVEVVEGVFEMRNGGRSARGWMRWQRRP